MRNWLQHLTFRRLIISALILLVLGVAARVWGAGADIRALRERAYPIPSTHCQKPQNCDERALQIDAREAITSDNALDVAFGQLALSILGIGGVGLTLYYAHLAWGEAGKSATAAKLALEHAKESSERQLRAYVMVEARGIKFSEANSVEYAIKAHNRGQTPARRVLVKWAAKMTAEKLSNSDIERLHTVARCPAEEPAFILGPGESRDAIALEIGYNARNATDIRDSKLSFYVVGSIDYIDAFEKTRTTKFCHMYTGVDNGPNGAEYYHYGNDYT
jgi:hypothetical protein